MSLTLYVMPLKEDKLSAYQEFFATLLNEKRKEYADLLLRYDLNSIDMWYKKFGDRDYAIFMHDQGPEAQERLENWAASTNPFDLWFDEQLKACYDFDTIGEAPVSLGGFDARNEA